MKTLLVATDFSPAALNASNYAADMAMAINASIHLLHVYSIPVSYSEIPLPINEADIKKNAENKINEIKNQLYRKTEGKINIETEVVMGSFFYSLQESCDRIQPYLVVLGSQGTTSAERLLFGGHTVYAMKHLMWPIITVPLKARFTAIQKVGLACDFDNVIDTTPIDEIKILVNDFNAELHVLNTSKKKEFKPEAVFESGMLEEMLSPLKHNYHFLTNDDIDEGILEFVETNNIDLLMVLPKRHNLFDAMIHSSHTKRLVLHSHVPVMALHTSS